LRSLHHGLNMAKDKKKNSDAKKAKKVGFTYTLSDDA
jgi:hypothetical protein